MRSRGGIPQWQNREFFLRNREDRIFKWEIRTSESSRRVGIPTQAATSAFGPTAELGAAATLMAEFHAGVRAISLHQGASYSNWLHTFSAPRPLHDQFWRKRPKPPQRQRGETNILNRVR